MDFNSFERSIGRNKPLPIYIVFGEDTFLIRRAVSLIKDKVLKGANVELSLSEYDGKDVTFGQIFDELWTVPFLGRGNSRLIMIDEADDFLSKYKKKLTECLSSPSSYASLLLVCNGYKGELGPADKFSDKWVSVKCEKVRDYQLPSWISRMVKAHGKGITDVATQILVEETGNNLELLEKEIEKLFTYVDDRSRIEEADVRELVHGGRRQTIFDLTNAMADKDASKALKILDRLIAFGEDSTKIISLFAWQMKRLWLAKRIIKACGNDTPKVTRLLQDKLKIKPYFCNGFIRQVGHFTEEDLQAKYALLAEADVETKTGGMAPQIILESLLIRLCK